MAGIGTSNRQLALHDPDVQLMVRVGADEPGAFKELVEKYQARLVSVMHHLVGRADEAEDLAQEVFLRIYRARKRYEPRCKFSTWLFTIANRLALNALRTRQRKPVVALPGSRNGAFAPLTAEELVADRAAQPYQRLQQKELAEVVRRAVDGLNERQRLAVLLNKFEGMGYAEIAEVMGLTAKAVKSLLSRARSNLRVALQDYVCMDSQPVPDMPDAE